MKHNDKYYYYQTGISLEGEKKSAGRVLLSLFIEQAFAEGCREFDFLRGNEGFKYFWTKDQRQTWSITLRKHDFHGTLAHNTSLLLRNAKSVLRPFLVRWPRLQQVLKMISGQMLKGGATCC